MQRKRDGLVPIGEILSDLDAGPHGSRTQTTRYWGYLSQPDTHLCLFRRAKMEEVY